MGYRYLDDFRRGISVFAIFLTVLRYWVPPNVPLLGFCPLSKQRCFTFDLRPGTVNENPRTGNPPAEKYHLWYSLSDIHASNLLK